MVADTTSTTQAGPNRAGAKRENPADNHRYDSGPRLLTRADGAPDFVNQNLLEFVGVGAR